MIYVRIKPTIVEAIQCFTTSESIAQIEKFVGNSVKINNNLKPPHIEISTYTVIFRDCERVDLVLIHPGDYILRDEEGYFNTMTKDEFEEEFKEVSE
nr:MAG TPA: PGDYG protein [Bacteriophage sp.]